MRPQPRRGHATGRSRVERGHRPGIGERRRSTANRVVRVHPEDEPAVTLIVGHQHDIYGNVIDQSGSLHDERQFAGEQADPTGLTYLRARFYDAANGRFLSRDPLPEAITDPAVHQPYSYAGDNPATVTDPSGKYGCGDPDDPNDATNCSALVGPDGLPIENSTSQGPTPAQIQPLANQQQAAVQAAAAAAWLNPFATAESEAFFWSGRTVLANGEVFGGAERAAEIATAEGGTTLEMLMQQRGIQLPEWDPNNQAVVDAWDAASKQFADGASGTVRVVLGENVRVDSVWNRVELPALVDNPMVTNIIAVDPATLDETVIFSRPV